MSAGANRWAAEPDEAPPVERTLADADEDADRPAKSARRDAGDGPSMFIAPEPRAPLDLDRLIEVVFTVFAFVMYATGALLAAAAWGTGGTAWAVAGLILAGLAVPPMAYVLVKSSQRRAERERRERFEAGRERTNHDAVTAIEFPR